MRSTQLSWQSIAAIIAVSATLLAGYNNTFIAPLQEQLKEERNERIKADEKLSGMLLGQSKETTKEISTLRSEFKALYHGLDVSNAELTIQLRNQAQATEKLALAVERLYARTEG